MTTSRIGSGTAEDMRPQSYNIPPMDPAPADASHWGAVLALDEAALAGHARRPPEAGNSSDQLGAELAQGWLTLMRGDALALESKMAPLFSRAASARSPRRVIEATALRALVSASAGKLSEAIVFARRASLMARTEAEPRAELLANLVLARMRRHAGKPHLAVRILEALARIGPEAPRAWLDWERLLAGGTPPDAAAVPGAAGDDAASAGRRLLLAARAGARPAFDRAADDLIGATAVWRDLQDEARTLVALLDSERDPPAELREFCSGEADGLRFGLHGARVVLDEQEPGISIFAVARPGQVGRRILVDGLGLSGAARALVPEDGARRAHGRTDAGLAALVLGGPQATPEAAFFRRVYGFAYSTATHRGVLDVLVHRMRKRIGGGGIIVRSDGGLALALQEGIAVADPRCSPPAAARILSALSRQPLATAEDIAARLGITLRAAQIALQQLVTDGACLTRRAGRHLEYQLRDTTFREPTSSDALRGSE
jgi:hypothetical protein